MNDKEIDTFKRLFSDYCFQEIRKGHCAEDDCEFCSVNHAYDKIFYDSVDDEDEEDDEFYDSDDGEDDEENDEEEE